jgi:pyruvate decarboxylase
MYVGSNTIPEIKERVESADLLIQVGGLLSDFNTASFSYRTPRSSTIGLHSDRVEVGFATFEGVRMKPLLPKLSKALRNQRDERLEQTKKRLPRFDNSLPSPQEEVSLGADEKFVQQDGISQGYIWPRIGQFLRSGDQVLAETGTSSFGALAMRLPSNDMPSFHSQVLWGSIGWSLPACLGVSLATREEGTGNRVILFIGDGSFQLTAQEVSTMVREGLSPIMFVLSNDGYEIERQVSHLLTIYSLSQSSDRTCPTDPWTGTKI